MRTKGAVVDETEVTDKQAALLLLAYAVGIGSFLGLLAQVLIGK